MIHPNQSQQTVALLEPLYLQKKENLDQSIAVSNSSLSKSNSAIPAPLKCIEL
jgi:hypothetical protein